MFALHPFVRMVVLVLGALSLVAATCAPASAQRRARSKPVKVRAVPVEPVTPSGPSNISSNEVHCVDPPVGDAPTERQRVGVARRARIGATDEDRILSRGSEHVSFATGAGGAAAAGGAPRIAANLGTDCRSKAIYAFYDGGRVLPAMPTVNYPDQPCQDRSACVETTRSWIAAHHNVWIAREMMHFIAAEDSSHVRSHLWKQPGVDANGNKASIKTSPAYWFGPYSNSRFESVKQAIDKLWGVMRSNETGGIDVHLKCPFKSKEPNNVCFTASPGAHHWVKGWVNLCPTFYDAERTDFSRALLMTHELLHHLWIKHGKIWVAIQDKHYHGHGVACVAKPDSSSQYGEDKIRHLATYRNSSNRNCGHLSRNVRNNDTYAYFITWVGESVYHERMAKWPAPSPPTPQPPDCVDEEGCLCSDADTWVGSEPFQPDGDYRADQYCGEHDGEMTCQATSFGATVRGICTKCDQRRGAGCECDDGRPCDVGSCFGKDTHGSGGTGVCFDGHPPAWACPVDCERLLNDDNAWCLADYPSGRAHCMDALCSAPKADQCHQQGRVCRYGDCVVECDGHADCAERGYPATFSCQQHRCEYTP